MHNIYLIKSWGKYHIARELVLRQFGSEEKKIITAQDLVDLSRRYSFRYGKNRSFRDEEGITWYLDIEWVKHVTLTSMQSIKEVCIESLEDLLLICSLDDVCEIDQLTLFRQLRNEFTVPGLKLRFLYDPKRMQEAMKGVCTDVKIQKSRFVRNLKSLDREEIR